jgi:FkbM family methyltransferase
MTLSGNTDISLSKTGAWEEREGGFPDVWEELKSSPLPTFVYGMGNGADKILDVMAKKGIAPAGFFASDEFVRGHFFRGHLVHKLSEIEAKIPEFNLVCAFGSSRPEVLACFREISKRRTGRGGFFAPDVPVCGENLFDRAFFEAHESEISEAEKLFTDEKSKRLYRNIISFKLTGDISYLEGDSDTLEGIYKEAAEGLEMPVYADLGAYDGDTVRLFAEHFTYKKIYAFEPHIKNFKKLCDKTADLKNIEYINAAAWNETGEIVFSNTDNRNNNAFSPAGGEAPAGVSRENVSEAEDTDAGGKKSGLIKAVPADEIIGRADIIKLDVEGAEAQAISGLESNIKRGAAVICAVYHRSEDIFRLPLMLQKMCSEYTFSLRKVPYVPAWDVFLICRKNK